MSTSDEVVRVSGRRTIRIADFLEISNRVNQVIELVRDTLLKPNGRKAPPQFSTARVGELNGMDIKQVDYRAKRGDLPSGSMKHGRRTFSLQEQRIWAREFRKTKMRPEGAEAITITVANFKGGVSKTTTAVTLAQGLSMRGHSVLLIDSDPQGSATGLFGMLPIEVDDEHTLRALCQGEQESVEYAIQKTYWEGLDLIPAVNSLFAAEFDLPARQMQRRDFQFWNVLHFGIDSVRPKYDVIIIDTPPALSYLTINALMAADGILMPLPPSQLDFMSSAGFWSLFSALTQGLQERGENKEFEFINVLLSKVDPDSGSASEVRKWISGAYVEMVLPMEIPITKSAESASAEFGTVYDQPRKAATEAYDRMVTLVEEQINAAWHRQANLLGAVA